MIKKLLKLFKKDLQDDPIQSDRDFIIFCSCQVVEDTYLAWLIKGIPKIDSDFDKYRHDPKVWLPKSQCHTMKGMIAVPRWICFEKFIDIDAGIEVPFDYDFYEARRLYIPKGWANL